MSRIFLVQSAGSLDGADGYSYGLLHGGHKHLLISFVDFMNAKQATIHKRPADLMDRRPLSRRGRDHLAPVEASS